MTRQIFRKEALERLASPEQLDQLMPVTDRRGWLALVAIGLVLFAGVVWGIAGSIPVTIEATGLLMRQGGVEVLTAAQASVVTDVQAAPGDMVQAGQELLRLEAGGSVAPLSSPRSGRVLDVAVAVGDAVEPATALVTLESPDGPLRAILYCPAVEASRIRPGMEVQVLGGSPSPGGLGRGQVERVGRFPATRAAVARRLKSEAWADSFLRLGPVVEVVVALAAPPAQVSSGTPCRAKITVHRQRPIELLLPSSGG